MCERERERSWKRATKTEASASLEASGSVGVVRHRVRVLWVFVACGDRAGIRRESELVPGGAEIVSRGRVRILSLPLQRVRVSGHEVGVLVCEGVEAIGCA